MKTARGLEKVGLFGLAMVALGCHAAPEPSGTGTVRLQLVASVGVETYRLHGATFTVTNIATGAVTSTLSSDTDPSATVVSTALPTGSYAVSLASGWDLERLVGATFTVVDAHLTSANPAPFMVLADHTTTVAFQFHTSGGAVTFGTGTLDISIDIVVDADAGVDPAACVAAGADCLAAGTSCCRGLTCQASSGLCAAPPPPPPSCVTVGAACNVSGATCCAGSTCEASSGLCVAPPVVTCSSAGGDCRSHTCCDGNTCFINNCAPTSSIFPDCPATGQACSTGGPPCCSGICSASTGTCVPR